MPINVNQLDQAQTAAGTKELIFNEVFQSNNMDAILRGIYEIQRATNSQTAHSIGSNPNSAGSGSRTSSTQNQGGVGGSGAGGTTIGGGGNPNQGGTYLCFKFGTKTEGKITHTATYHGIFKLLKIETENGHSVYVTGEHPFIVNGHETVKASELLPGDVLTTKEGLSKIKSVGFGGLTYRVLNHETADHVFWANGILVHNKIAGGTGVY